MPQINTGFVLAWLPGLTITLDFASLIDSSQALEADLNDSVTTRSARS